MNMLYVMAWFPKYCALVEIICMTVLSCSFYFSFFRLEVRYKRFCVVTTSRALELEQKGFETSSWRFASQA